MEHLASLTGGRAFYNTNDVSAMLDQSVNEGGHYYRLTTPRRTSGGTERIATSQSPCGRGVPPRVPTGYFALATGQPKEADSNGLGRLLHQGALELSDVLLRANVSPPPGPGGETTVDLVVDASSISFVTGVDGLRRAKLLVFLAANGKADSRPEKNPSSLLVWSLRITKLHLQVAFPYGRP